MSAILLTDTDVLRLSAQVNVQRAAGLIPTGGLLANKGTYFQLMVTGESTVTYTVVMEASDRDFQAKANILSGLGAFALGTPQYINGFWTQAFGDMAGSGGGGGGSLPDGDTVDQTIQWDGSAWQPGIIPANAATYSVDDALGAPLPTVHVSSAGGYPLGILVVDATGQANAGIYIVDGANPVFTFTGTPTGWQLAGAAGTAGVNSTTTQAQFISPNTSSSLVASNSGVVLIGAGGNASVSLNTGALFPTTTNVTACGKAGNVWTAVWATNGTIQTSDATYKTEPLPITDAVLDAVGDVDLVSFKMLDAVALKGDAARTHFGVIAQQVLSAFAAHGLDATDYGVVCYEEWEAEPALFDSEGREVSPARPAGSMWAVRYDELLVLEAARVRRALSS